MTWREIERDERYRVPFVLYRCSSCGKLGVSTNPYLQMTPCVCKSAR